MRRHPKDNPIINHYGVDKQALLEWIEWISATGRGGRAPCARLLQPKKGPGAHIRISPGVLSGRFLETSFLSRGTNFGVFREVPRPAGKPTGAQYYPGLYLHRVLHHARCIEKARSRRLSKISQTRRDPFNPPANVRLCGLYRP